MGWRPPTAILPISVVAGRSGRSSSSMTIDVSGLNSNLAVSAAAPAPETTEPHPERLGGAENVSISTMPG
jgi:hypothetical protein